MTDFYNSVLVYIDGTIDNVNKTFDTPTRYLTGTIKFIINGQIYESDDENYGWTEINNKSVEFFNSPLEGDVIQAFYQELDSKHLGLQDVKGSPFDPNGLLP
jgi:hypothetical protein